MGAGAVTTLPILGQAQVSPGAPGATDAMPAVMHAGHAATQIPTEKDWKPLFFDEHQNQTVIALTEIMIPQTDTPGAKAALVNRYIDLVLNEEDSDVQKSAIEGLAWIDGRSLKLHGKPFIQLASDQQTALLTPLADPANRNPEDQPGVRFFNDFKDLTIFGYYTSQPGLERELEYTGDDYHTDFPGACTHPEHQS